MRPRNTLAYAIAVMVVCLIAVSVVGTYALSSALQRTDESAQTVTKIVAERQAAADRRFCAIMEIITRNDPAKGPKPTTPRGFEQQKQDIEDYKAFQVLAIQLGCSVPPGVKLIPTPAGAAP